jgi:hypothetical protein
MDDISVEALDPHRGELPPNLGEARCLERSHQQLDQPVLAHLEGDQPERREALPQRSRGGGVGEGADL